MQFRTSLLRALFISFPVISFSQSTYLPFGGKESWLLDRMEIKLQTNSDFNLSTVKPYVRNIYVRQGEIIDSLIGAGANPAGFSKVDQYNLDRFLANNTEYTTYQKESWKSKKAILNTFYASKGNLLEVNNKDFYLSVNPAINAQMGFGNNDKEGKMYVNTRGAIVRGLIAKKIAFNVYVSDNQERGPQYFQDRVNGMLAVPGVGFYKSFKKTAFDYFDARGSIATNVTKYVNVQFGFDKNIIGNGYRSLFLSDYANSYLFLKLNTRIWKLNYTNIFTELMPAFKVNNGNSLLPRKYAAMHHLSYNVNKWLNIGLFESVMFGRKDHFDFSYLIPVIFLRSMESNNGSADNSNVGFDFKANIAHKIQLYGQLMLDELRVKEAFNGKKWWGNKQAIQLGAKYVDAFGISNLDLQGEANFIRPFVYSHYDSAAGYNHYNQPLAHPLGANVKEVIAIAKYQPVPKLYLTVKGIFWKQGLDSVGGHNWGSNIFKVEDYDNPLLHSRIGDYGFSIGDGLASTGINASVVASYEVRENLFLDASVMQRNLKINGFTSKTSMFTLGFRWNLARREYDY